MMIEATASIASKLLLEEYCENLDVHEWIDENFYHEIKEFTYDSNSILTVEFRDESVLKFDLNTNTFSVTL